MHIEKCLYHLCKKPRRQTRFGLSRYCSRACSNRHHILVRRRRIKQKAIDYLGGKCQVCGYDKCPASLDFHHRDAREKEFGISEKGDTRSWERIRTELDKCDLLCSNCHSELHYAEWLKKVGASLDADV